MRWTLRRRVRAGALVTPFNEIYSRDAPPLFRYLRRLTASRLKAEDLLQETFLKLHLQLGSGVPLDNPRAWLFRVATNLARDREKADIRARIREQRYEGGAVVVDFTQRVEQQQRVRRALDALSPRMRQALLLHGEGFTYREIADIADIEPGYVGVLLQRARAEFRRTYEYQNVQRRERAPGSSVR